MNRFFSISMVAIMAISMTFVACEPEKETDPVSDKLEGIAFADDDITITVDQKYALELKAIPSGVDLPTCTFTSNDKSVATVDKSGVVTAIAEGEAIITATTSNGKFSAVCYVTVIDGDVPPPPDYVIEAYYVKLTEEADIANVIGYMEGEDDGDILAAAAFYDNGFELTLPGIVKDEYLTEMSEGFFMGELWILAFDYEDSQIGEIFKFGASEGEAYWMGWHYYAKSNYQDQYVTLKKGWNEIFWVFDWDTEEQLYYTTEEPAGTDWVFYDGEGKKSGNQAIYQKLQNLKKRKGLK
jgi:hypothetical protein